MSRKYEVVLYGATGYTGSLCAEYLQTHYPDLKWAIAGRNEVKLEKLRKELKLNCDVLVAEAKDLGKLKSIAAQTKVMMSAAGPFNRYGSGVVRACVEEGTHYCDTTGETHWIKKLIERHHEEAKRKGIRIIPSCGYDSIPADLGTYFAVQQFQKPVRKVELFQAAKGDISGGTTETMFTRAELPKDADHPFLLNPKGTVSFAQKQASQDCYSVNKIKDSDFYSGKGLMAFINTRIVRRSVALMEQDNKPYGKDFIYQEYGAYKNPLLASAISLGLIAFTNILRTPLRHLIRPLMRKPGEGPSKEARESGWFKSIFVAEAQDGEKKVCTVSASGDPGYKGTSTFVSESAIALAREKNLPGGKNFGGVLTPAVGIGETLIKRLQKANIKFEVA